MDVRRDVIDRLEAAGVPYYVTGSEAMAIHGIAFRATNDIDIVLGISPAAYEALLRPRLEPDYVVNDLVAVPPRWLGAAIATDASGKADLILRAGGAWADAAMDRRMRVQDPGIGSVWVSTPEDLLVAKLEWSGGDLSGLQGRDLAALVAAMDRRLDWSYVEAHATRLGLGGILEEVRSRARDARP